MYRFIYKTLVAFSEQNLDLRSQEPWRLGQPSTVIPWSQLHIAWRVKYCTRREVPVVLMAPDTSQCISIALKHPLPLLSCQDFVSFT